MMMEIGCNFAKILRENNTKGSEFKQNIFLKDKM
jgi:hypothetical protein